MINVFWFRRDLRFEDNKGLLAALKAGRPVLGIFILDTTILEKLEGPSDARVEFLLNQLEQMTETLTAYGSGIEVFHGRPSEVFSHLCEKYSVDTVFTNRDYEPYAVKRDAQIQSLLDDQKVGFETEKDHVIFEKSEVVKDDGSPYVVFTPYKRKWLSVAENLPEALKVAPSEKHLENFVKNKPSELPSLKQLGFESSMVEVPGKKIKRSILTNYQRDRDFPALNGTTRLGVHLRFGTTSIRKAVGVAAKTSETWLSELIWREFYSQVLWHFPHSATRSFRSRYDNIHWLNNSGDFAAWCEGRTGYPIVDAGMRELVQTGHMHNRVRMVTASFLTKHLLIDWRWGERFFAKHLLDFDLASNVGGWQWAAGSGTDAAPYFRVFNPESQLKKFDKDLQYTKMWVPELETSDYPEPIVDHKVARQRCLDAYKEALG